MFVSGFRPEFVSCGRRAPQGAAVVARLARHRLKPCRGDTAACCRKATRRSQGSWPRVAQKRIRLSHMEPYMLNRNEADNPRSCA